MGLIPASSADAITQFKIKGKDGLTLLNDRPLVALTPTNRLFIHNNGVPPQNVNPVSWSLTFDGESATRTKSYSIRELQEKFENIERQLALECGGNGRSEFNLPVPGNQRTLGAVGCPLWNGVHLKDS